MVEEQWKRNLWWIWWYNNAQCWMGKCDQPNPGGYGGGGGGAGGAGASNVHGQGGAGLAYPDFTGPLIGVPGLPGTYAAGGPKSGTEGR